MTAKEKAVELVEKYSHLVRSVYPKDAIECAKIAIDEILGSPGDIYWGKNEDEIDFTNYFTYWKEVKEELEKL